MLMDAYHAMLSGVLPPSGFNESLMIFLAKGDDPMHSTITTRTPSHTRPLNLSNTDQQIMAKLIDRPLSKLA